MFMKTHTQVEAVGPDGRAGDAVAGGRRDGDGGGAGRAVLALEHRLYLVLCRRRLLLWQCCLLLLLYGFLFTAQPGFWTKKIMIRYTSLNTTDCTPRFLNLLNSILFTISLVSISYIFFYKMEVNEVTPYSIVKVLTKSVKPFHRLARLVKYICVSNVRQH